MDLLNNKSIIESTQIESEQIQRVVASGVYIYELVTPKNQTHKTTCNIKIKRQKI